MGAAVRPRTPGLLEPPRNLPALESERARLERELAVVRWPRARRLLACERRRVIVRQDELAEAASATRETGH